MIKSIAEVTQYEITDTILNHGTELSTTVYENADSACIYTSACDTIVEEASSSELSYAAAQMEEVGFVFTDADALVQNQAYWITTLQLGTQYKEEIEEDIESLQELLEEAETEHTAAEEAQETAEDLQKLGRETEAQDELIEQLEEATEAAKTVVDEIEEAIDTLENSIA